MTRSAALSTMALLASAMVVVAGLGAVASAHTPHDPATQVLLSPAYVDDSTGFVVTEGRILRSDDGMNTFVNIVNGVTSVVTSVAMSPADAKTVYATTSDGAVLRSVDGGLSFPTLAQVSAEALLVRSSVASGNADVIVIADLLGAAWRSSDGGSTWSPISGLDAVTQLAGATSGPERFFAATATGDLLITDDGGATWTPAQGLGTSAISAIVDAPDDPLHVYVGDETGAIAESVDGGATFEPLPSVGIDGDAVLDIAVHENAGGESTIWVTNTNGPHRSSDGGATFEPVVDGLTVDAQAEDLFAPGFTSLAVDPDGEALLAGFDGLFRLDTTTETWNPAETRADDISGLAISPNFVDDGTVFVSTYVKGAYRSDDRGTQFTSIGTGLEQSVGRTNTVLPLVRLQNVVFSPDFVDDRTLFSSTASALLASNDGGSSWQRVLTAQSDPPSAGHYVIGVGRSTAGPVVVAGSRLGIVVRSDRDGASGSWTALADLRSSVRSVVLSPDFAAVPELFVATAAGIFRSADGGSTFELVVDSVRNAVLAISPDFAEDRTIFAGSADGLTVSLDGGQTWTAVGVVFAPTTVEAIGVSPGFRDDGIVLVSLKGLGMFRSSDRGSSFDSVSTSLTSFNLIASDSAARPTSNPIQFASDGTAFAYAGDVVLVSDDAGTTWTRTRLPSFESFVPPTPGEDAVPGGADPANPADANASQGAIPVGLPGDVTAASERAKRNKQIWLLTGSICVTAAGGMFLTSRRRRRR